MSTTVGWLKDKALVVSPTTKTTVRITEPFKIFQPLVSPDILDISCKTTL